MFNLYSLRIITRVFLLLSISVALLLSACSSSKLAKSWADPALQAPLMGEVFVVGVTHQETFRRLVEDSLVEGISAEGRKGIASYAVMENKGEVNLEEVKSALVESGAASFLVVRLADTTSVTLSQDATGQNYETMDKFERDPLFWNPNPKQSVRTTTRMTLLARVYNVETKQLLWSAYAHFVDPVMTRKYTDKMAKLFVKDLEAQGLL